MPSKVALILEEVSNYNNGLRVQRCMEKSVCIIQNNMIRQENIHRPKISATSKEHAPNVSDDKNANN